MVSTTQVVVLSILVATLVAVTPTLCCTKSNTSYMYLWDPHLRNDFSDDDYVRACIHVDTSPPIAFCSGGCEGDFKHNVVTTTDASVSSADLQDQAKRSCSVSNTECCRVSSTRQENIQFTFLCIDPDYYPSANDGSITYEDSTTLLAASCYLYFPFQLSLLFSGVYGIVDYRVITLTRNHPTAHTCACHPCYPSSGVSENFCNRMTEPVP